MREAPRLLWIAPEEKGGIRSYSEVLWPEIKKLWPGVSLDIRFSLPNADEIASLKPDLIHVQHEFGLFGSKTPGFYRFPKWISEIRRALPSAKIIATGHNVLSANYRYEYASRGWQIPFRFLLNQTLLPVMRRSWLQGTWGIVDGVIVHSQLQTDAVRKSGCKKIAVIPHFVPEVSSARQKAGDDTAAPAQIVVFGFICPDKGQDVAIRALSRMKNRAQLVLAGGIRREKDQAYLDHCLKLARELGVQDRVRVTGYIPSEKVDETYANARVVLAPFRETSGSGSLAQAMARGAAILASDLPLNRELTERTSGCLEFFRSEDADDCARELDRLLNESSIRSRLSAQSLKYASENAPSRIAQAHIGFYGLFFR